MTDDELIELGREVDTDPTRDRFMRQGRPITNVEMHAVGVFMRDQRRKAEQFLSEEL